MDSPFEVLGIGPDASEAEVVDAYRRRVKAAHPDNGGSAEEFQRVKTAYERIQAGDGGDPAEYAGNGRAASNGARPRSTGSGSARSDGASGPAGGATARASNDAGGATATDETGSYVEYLNYDVLDDHGWDLGDEDLFEKASNAGLDPDDYGRLLVEPDETLLEAAENRGFAWPFACRGGACTNCAVAVVEGEMPTPPGHILPPELLEKGIRLSCISAPTTEDMKVVYNVKHLPGVDELRLSPSRFERTYAND